MKTIAYVRAVLAASLLFTGSAASAALINVAQSGTATQSTTINNTAIAEKAINGITDGNYFVNEGTHTMEEEAPWWQVVFDNDYLISQISVFNRTDCCSSRLDGARLILLNNGAEVFSHIIGAAPSDLTLSTSDLLADTFRIEGARGFLSIAEAQAFAEVTNGVTVPEPGTMTLMGVAIFALVLRRRRT